MILYGSLSAHLLCTRSPAFDARLVRFTVRVLRAPVETAVLHSQSFLPIRLEDVSSFSPGQMVKHVSGKASDNGEGLRSRYLEEAR